MTDGVKFIFKTLIKVPVYIVAAFGIFNIFAFCFIYFRLLGVSYVVQQTAIENTYPGKLMGSLAESSSLKSLLLPGSKSSSSLASAVMA